MVELYIALKALYDGATVAAYRATHDLTAAQVLAAAVALRAGMVGGYHLGTAPHGTAVPHVTLTGTADATSGTMGLRYLEGTIVTFHIWVDRYGLDAGLRHMANLKKVFDNQMPTFAGGGGTVLNVRQGTGLWTELPEPEGGFGIHVDYKFQYR